MSWPNRNESALRRSHLRGAIAVALSLAAVAANAQQTDTNNGPVSAAGGFYSASFTYRW